MVRPGIVAHHEDGVGPLEITEVHAPLAESQDPGKADPGRLVAKISAAGDIVGAQLSGKELDQERSLIGRPPRNVEDRLVGIFERGKPGPG